MFIFNESLYFNCHDKDKASLDSFSPNSVADVHSKAFTRTKSPTVSVPVLGNTTTAFWEFLPIQCRLDFLESPSINTSIVFPTISCILYKLLACCFE